ncbi:thioredoxin family protein [Siminovitchia sediminis]|uniref:Thioredoxin family protein n=1 Tax=Siminovitchia sediminis TaxID=1274353 RepID=A0ABW4KHX9_9BACI
MMKPVHTLEDIHAAIRENPLVLLYISRNECSVCHGLLPQVEDMLKEFPGVVPVHAKADEIPAVAGEFSIFTVPVVLVFVKGRELLRKARFVPIGELREQLRKIIDHI